MRSEEVLTEDVYCGRLVSVFLTPGGAPGWQYTATDD